MLNVSLNLYLKLQYNICAFLNPLVTQSHRTALATEQRNLLLKGFERGLFF